MLLRILLRILLRMLLRYYFKCYFSPSSTSWSPQTPLFGRFNWFTCVMRWLMTKILSDHRPTQKATFQKCCGKQKSGTWWPITLFKYRSYQPEHGSTFPFSFVFFAFLCLFFAFSLPFWPIFLHLATLFLLICCFFLFFSRRQSEINHRWLQNSHRGAQRAFPSPTLFDEKWFDRWWCPPWRRYKQMHHFIAAFITDGIITCQ